MSTDRKIQSKHLLELWGDNAPHHPADYLSPDYVNHQMPDATGGTSTKSLEEWKCLVADFHEGFADVKMEILLQVAEGDYVCTRWRMTARHMGGFRGLPESGRTTTWTGVQTDRYEQDLLVESWVDWDKYSFLENLELVGRDLTAAERG